MSIRGIRAWIGVGVLALAATAHAHDFDCEVVRVIDGDTVVIDIRFWDNMGLVGEHMRFARGDAPELRGQKQKALEALEALGVALQDTPLACETSGERGSFGRLLGCPITASGVNLCDWMIEEGWNR